MTKLQSKMTSRRAVAPVIATLLLVAIAVVGGSIVFVFSQGFFSSAQISGSPNIESLKFTGYDASDGITLENHDGTTFAAANTAGNGLVVGEKVAVYVQSNSVGKLTLSEVRIGGTVYNYTATNPAPQGEFNVLTRGPGTILGSTSAEVQPGQQVTVIATLDENIKSGRDTQFKLTTANGAVFVGTVIAGQQSG
ncbi:MAG: archaellin/type IV pilin N-terminal domain-containing protein [Candidatus Nitrosopumilus sp. bin_32a]